MQLQRLQQQLERIYEVEFGHNVDDFLITDERLANSLHPNTAREKLLVVEDGDNLDLALYLDREIVRALRENDPLARLDNHNLDAFLMALEGVSHFLYLGWKASYDSPVSKLELELQAEVDKYITSAILLSMQRPGRLPPDLRRRLFEEPALRDGLQRHEEDRYRKANDLAHAYCRQLERYYRHDFGSLRMFNDLRRFYRLPQAGKLRHIGAPALQH